MPGAQIVCKTSYALSFTVWVDCDDTIWAVKQTISSMIGFSPRSIRLYFIGQNLEDGHPDLERYVPECKNSEVVSKWVSPTKWHIDDFRLFRVQMPSPKTVAKKFGIKPMRIKKKVILFSLLLSPPSYIVLPSIAMPLRVWRPGYRGSSPN